MKEKINSKICGIICVFKGEEGEQQVQRCDKTQCRCGNYAAILALIEQEQKAMREALDAAKVHLLSGANDIGKDAVLAKIDAVLEGK